MDQLSDTLVNDNGLTQSQEDCFFFEEKCNLNWTYVDPNAPLPYFSAEKWDEIDRCFQLRNGGPIIPLSPAPAPAPAPALAPLPLDIQDDLILTVSFQELERLFKRYICTELSYNQHLDFGPGSKCWTVGKLFQNYESYKNVKDSIHCEAK
jgi:hypothetical protein